MTSRARRLILFTALLAGSLLASATAPVLRAGAKPSGGPAVLASDRFIIVLAGTQGDGVFVPAAPGAVDLIRSAGGSISADLSRQIGVVVAKSTNPLFAKTLSGSALIEIVGQDFSWKAMPDLGGAEQTNDPLESQQWDMMQIQAPEAHDVQAGNRAVDVGILDTGIDGHHVDFRDQDGTTNVDCARGRDFISVGPGIGNPDPCIDNGFHGTHVAGTVGAQANNIGIVGVAPNVTLVPVKVCDSAGYCYASSSTAGITYAGDIKLDVINMSFFVDDDEFLESTEFKCLDDPTQAAFRRAVERAIKYARARGVTPVAALGNSDNDLANPPEPYVNSCDVVPAETDGVIGTMSLGRQSQKASYSNYGAGEVDVAAPGGAGTTGDCSTTILSTFPGSTYGCIQGTSMASPHAAGVAALIVSQFGSPGRDGDILMAPGKVQNYLQSTTIDIGLPGYDECFGNGRINALRAVKLNTSSVHDATAPNCPEYNE